MAFRKIILSLVIFVHVCSVLSQNDPACTTPLRKAGFCVPIERCRNVNAIVKSPTPPSRGIQNYINRAGCTLPGVERSICCQPTEIVPRRPLLPEDCGDSIVIPKISGGNTTEPFQYPWMVVIRHLNNTIWEDKCGGSLINNRYVLTAAHCVKTADVKLLGVRLGEQDKSKDIDCIVYTSNETMCAKPPIDVAVEITVVHHKYKPTEYVHDIALIRMAEKVTYSDSIKPICLPVAKDLRNQVPPRYIVAGWGMTEKQTVSEVLMQAILKPVSPSNCAQIFERFPGFDFSEAYQICAGGENHVDTCGGDSGGPLGFHMPQAKARFVQYGIVTGGIKSCGEWSFPGLYANVSSHMDWIVQNMYP